MFKNIASVGLMTLLSRLFGLLRDIVQANIIGGGILGDAFAIAFRIPNHFRAIFAEGAFNAAFVPTFNKISAEQTQDQALEFADRMFMLVLIVQLVFLGAALVAMPFIVGLLAPGFSSSDQRLPLAIDLTRITFPYLTFISLTVLISGVLNAVGKFAAAAATAVLLNVCMIAAMFMGAYFPTAGHALAVGVAVSGLLQFLLVAFAALRAGVMVRPRWPRLDANAKQFWRAFGPAVLGSAGVQIAVFADTIIASFLPAGRVNALYYADHINQLPIGVIGIAVGTVLLSDMSKRIASGDEGGARHAQLRAMELTTLFALPFVAAFIILPDVIIRALFQHGRTTFADATYAAELLRAYALGLLAFMLLRAMTVTFHARSDTKTPVKAMVLGIIFNIAVKLALLGPLEHVALGLGTALGAWVNILTLYYFARKMDYFNFDEEAKRVWPKLFAAGLLTGLVLWALKLYMPVTGALRLYQTQLAVYILACGLIYGLALYALFGKTYLRKIKTMRRGQSQ